MSGRYLFWAFVLAFFAADMATAEIERKYKISLRRSAAIYLICFIIFTIIFYYVTMLFFYFEENSIPVLVLICIALCSVGLVLLFLGGAMANSEKRFNRNCRLTYGTIIGYRVDNPRVQFEHEGKIITALCNTRGTKVNAYPPGTQIYIAYRVKDVFSANAYEVKAMDEILRPVSFEIAGKVMLCLGVILCLSGITVWFV